MSPGVDPVEISGEVATGAMGEASSVGVARCDVRVVITADIGSPAVARGEAVVAIIGEASAL